MTMLAKKPATDGNDSPATPPTGPNAALLDAIFHITERGSTISREFRGGLVTFFTMASSAMRVDLAISVIPERIWSQPERLPVSSVQDPGNRSPVQIGQSLDLIVTSE